MSETKLTIQLKNAISTMDIPEMRRELTTGNILWLHRNMKIKNGKHPQINEASKLIKDIMRCKAKEASKQ